MGCEGLRAAGLGEGQSVIRVSNRKLFDGLFDAGGVTDAVQRLTALRAVDKYDRLGLEGVRALLGEGRLDESGDYTKGARLPAAVIGAVEAFLVSAETLASAARACWTPSPTPGPAWAPRAKRPWPSCPPSTAP